MYSRCLQKIPNRTFTRPNVERRVWIGSHGASWSSINRNTVTNDDVQIRIYSPNLLFSVCLCLLYYSHCMRSNLRNGGQLCAHGVRMRRFTYFARIVFAYFIKKFNYIIIAVSLTKYTHKNVVSIGGLISGGKWEIVMVCRLEVKTSFTRVNGNVCLCVCVCVMTWRTAI